MGFTPLVFDDPNDSSGDYHLPNQDPVYYDKTEDSDINYSYPTTTLNLNRTKSTIRTGGRGVISSNNRHVVNRNGDYITRDVTNVAASNISISERVTVVAGEQSSGESYANVKASSSKAVYLLGNKTTGNVTDTQTLMTFNHSGGTKAIGISYSTYMKVAGQNFPRGRVDVLLQKYENGAYRTVKTLVSTTGNNNSEISTAKLDLSSGTYRVFMQATDLYTDTDRDSKGVAFYGKARATVSDVVSNTRKDNTYVLAQLIDRRTGNVVSSRTVAKGGGSETVRFSVPKGSNYLIKYTLYRGDGKYGGLYGNGGSFYVSGSTVTEGYTEYEYNDPDPEYEYTPSEPYRPPFNGEVVEEELDTEEELPVETKYCWIDSFKIYSAPIIEKEPDCFGEEVVVEVLEDGNLIDTYYYTSDDSFIDIEVENNSSSTRDYDVVLYYNHNCTGSPPIYLYGGKFNVNEQREPEASTITISGAYVEEQQDVIYSGLGSSLELKVYDEAGSLVHSDLWDGTGKFPFSVSYFDHLPYSNYRVEFISHQGGLVSGVTGISYLTDFRVTDIRFKEIWRPVPREFNSSLSFFIDDSLIGYWNAVGDGIFKHPVPKGYHTYKWVMHNNNIDYTYDYSELDWFKLTHWICDSVVITPYCEKGKGDKSIEALIKCLLEIWRQRPKGCVIGNRKIWLFT